MSSKVYLSGVQEFYDVIDWIAGIDSWDYGDGDLLSELVLKKDIPVNLRPIIADILSGTRKQKLKAASQLKIPAAERVYIAHTLSINLGLIDEFKSAKVITGESLISWQADRDGIEPIEAKRRLEGEAREIKSDAAAQLGVSVETIENLLRDFRKKLEKYPAV